MVRALQTTVDRIPARYQGIDLREVAEPAAAGYLNRET